MDAFSKGLFGGQKKIKSKVFFWNKKRWKLEFSATVINIFLRLQNFILLVFYTALVSKR